MEICPAERAREQNGASKDHPGLLLPISATSIRSGTSSHPFYPLRSALPCSCQILLRLSRVPAAPATPWLCPSLVIQRVIRHVIQGPPRISAVSSSYLSDGPNYDIRLSAPSWVFRPGNTTADSICPVISFGFLVAKFTRGSSRPPPNL